MIFLARITAVGGRGDHLENLHIGCATGIAKSKWKKDPWPCPAVQMRPYSSICKAGAGKHYVFGLLVITVEQSGHF